ncbi:MAG: hypothetical protein R3Y35_02915 [Clostridia bacterium]
MSIYIDFEELTYLKLNPNEQEIYEKGNLTAEHAKLLLEISCKEIREKLLNTIVENKLNPKQSRNIYYSMLKTYNIKGNKLPTQIYLNTIDNVVKKILDKGVNISSFKNETPHYFECIIRIPK